MPQDWIFGLLGGGLIGLAGAGFLLVNGRIMGASGILGGLIDGTAGQQSVERIAFLAGLIGVPAVLLLFVGPQETHLTSNFALIVAAGLLVGLGTRIGNGCTSGHGVCGISRFSVRGLVSTLFYIGAGAITVVLVRSFLGGLQ